MGDPRKNDRKTNWKMVTFSVNIGDFMGFGEPMSKVTMVYDTKITIPSGKLTVRCGKSPF
jgi:hypothetical protein